MAIDALVNEAARQLEATVERDGEDWVVTCAVSTDEDDPTPDDELDYERVAVVEDTEAETVTATASAAEYDDDTDLEAVLETLEDTVLARVLLGEPDEAGVRWIEVEASVPAQGATADWLAVAIQEVADVTADVAALIEADAQG